MFGQFQDYSFWVWSSVSPKYMGVKGCLTPLHIHPVQQSSHLSLRRRNRQYPLQHQGHVL